MATKAELEAELADLRKQLAERAAEASQNVQSEAPAALSDMLAAHGLSPEDITRAWDQLSREIGSLPQNRPLMTAVAAFGIGFVLGRMSRS
ncbi:hypothetical protein I5535_04900 [Rhodobacteraceae bacterium F11138]|nr:hypothetical protein [Rhodobacteraceae bacterium F11138]